MRRMFGLPALIAGLLLTGMVAPGGVTQARAEAKVVMLDIAERAVSGPDLVGDGPAPVLRVAQGDDVELRWTSDEGATIHLHGYNIETEIPAGGEVAVTGFTARATGRFPVETHGIGHDHHAAVLLFYLEVHPR